MSAALPDDPLPGLPNIMVAPNGGRWTRHDHPALPVTIPEIVEVAAECFAAGADGIHAHVRDADANHVLDAGLYRELIAELEAQVPEMAVQITTEARGKYSPAEQRDVVRAVLPKSVSVGLVEMTPDDSTETIAEARRFYFWAEAAGIALQHILYSPDELARFFRFRAAGTLPAGPARLLFVLGRYAADLESDPAALDPFLDLLEERSAGGRGELDWAICAFGRNETRALVRAARHGGKSRVGFENSFYNADGSRAASNAERVRDVIAALRAEAGGQSQQ